MNRRLGHIQISSCGSLSISDDLNNFWEKIILNEMDDGEHFEKMAYQNACGRDILWTIGWIAILMWWFSRYFWWSD